MGATFCFFQPFYVIHVSDKNNPCFGQKDIHHLVLSRIGIPISVPLDGDLSDFVQEERLGLPCRGGHIRISGHSDFRILNNDGASSSLTWV